MHREILDSEKLPPESRTGHIWARRYREINDWERYLADNGIRVVKMFLNVSREEQRTRFLRRIDRPEKNWKFAASDVRERQYWDKYQHAYSAMLSQTSTEWAPWYVLPADHKWFTRLCAAAVIAHTLIDIDPKYPAPDPAARQELEQAKGNSRPRRHPGRPVTRRRPDPALPAASWPGRTADLLIARSAARGLR